MICCIHAKAANKLERKPKRGEVEYGNWLMSKLRNEKKNNPEVEIVVSSEALGETLIKLKEKYDEQDLMECMKALLDVFNELKPEYMPPKEEVDRIAVEISSRDKMLKFSDCQIAAYALADMDSVVLVTTDKYLIESEELKKLEKELREEGKRTRKLEATDYWE